MKPIYLIETTLPDAISAERIAHRLLKECVAACVSLRPAVQSYYRWEGKLEHAAEIPMVIKTASDRVETAMQIVKEMHPYSVPEILAFRCEDGAPSYLDWVWQETRLSADV